MNSMKSNTVEIQIMRVRECTDTANVQAIARRECFHASVTKTT